MCSLLGRLTSARIASAVVLAWAWHAAGAAAQTAPLPVTRSAPILAWSAGDEQPAAPANPTVRHDPSVMPAASRDLVKQPNGLAQARQAAPAPSDPRRLAPPTVARPISLGQAPASRESLPFALPRIESLTTAGAGLAIVVGLFLMCAWLMRRSGPKPSSPLPKEAVALLGRVPLAANHFAHLLQLGNKLVLVSVGPDSVTSLAEVTDPNEVNRLLGLCTRNHKHSTTAEFHQVLEELASEPARGFLGDQASRGHARAGRS